MAGVNNDQLQDLILTTLKDLPDGEFEIMWDSQNYEICQIYQQHRRQVDGGTSIQRNVILDRKGNARYRRLFDTDNPSVDNVQDTIDVPWAQLSTDYSWDVAEILRNRSSKKGFINLIRSRRAERMWDLAELIEERGWLTPTSATDKLYPYGIPYYLNKLNSGVTTGGFSGQTIRYQGGTTGTICAGIDASTNAKWRNYADVYDKVDNNLLRKLRRATRLTRFRPSPMAIKPGQDGPGMPIKLYAGIDIVTELEDLADKRDDNTGPMDLAGKNLHSYEGSVYFNKMPFVYVPHLDDDTDDPIYCVDWTKIQPVVQDSYWMVESKPMSDRGQHTTITVFLDGSHNNLCINRRTAGFVIHKPTTA